MVFFLEQIFFYRNPRISISWQLGINQIIPESGNMIPLLLIFFAQAPRGALCMMVCVYRHMPWTMDPTPLLSCVCVCSDYPMGSQSPSLRSGNGECASNNSWSRRPMVLSGPHALYPTTSVHVSYRASYKHNKDNKLARRQARLSPILTLTLTITTTLLRDSP